MLILQSRLLIAPAIGGGGTDFSQIFHYDSFENGTPGDFLAGGGYHSTHSRYSTAISPKVGGQVLADVATQGEDENADGFYWTFPGGSQPKEGDELWMRICNLFPIGYDHTAPGAALKFLRAHVVSAADAHRGYVDLYLNNDDDPSGFAWQHLSEVLTGGADQDRFGAPSTTLQLGVWEFVEFYVRFGAVSTDSGGKGLMRTWVNGVFLHETSWQNTLASATDKVIEMLFRTYWNGTVQQTQTAYRDSFAVAAKIAGVRDDTPYLSTDGGGRIFIGTGTL